MTKQQNYSGRLELTWTNKDKRLLAHDDISYEWVDPADYRVSEVRLLRDAGTIGEVAPDRKRAGDNLLIRGDALHALTALANLPQFADEYAGGVKLVYIDPPFNTGVTFAQYDDNLEHSVWLTMLRDRLIQIKHLLSPDGSVWVHLDDDEGHRARVVLDEVFGESNRLGSIVWQKLYARKSNQAFSTSHDYIWIYAADESKFSRNLQPPSDEQLARYSNRDNDPRGPWQSVAFHVRTDNPDRRGEYRYPINLPSGREVLPPRGRHWNGKKSRYQELLAENRLWFGEGGDSLPRYKMYRDESEIGLVPNTWWRREEVGDNDEAKAEIQNLFPDIQDVFQTPKPERLMQRIISVASDPGDVVLDAFVGSGTTAAVAHKLGRRWIAIEWSESTLSTYAIPRMIKVVKGEDPGGITSREIRTPNADLPEGLSEGDGRKAAAVLKKYFDDGLLPVDERTLKDIQKSLRLHDKTSVSKEIIWSGGGGFRILDVAPSMFDEDEGMVFLSDWATDDDLAEATAAQLGFAYEPDAPFCGRKGRSRLAVMDGIATPEVVDLLVGALSEYEKLVLCATAVAPGAQEHLTDVSKGSKIRKIPASILSDYRVAYRARRRQELNLEGSTADQIGARPGAASG